MRAQQHRTISNRYHGAATRERGSRLPRLLLTVGGLVLVALLASTVLALSLETADWVTDSQWLRVQGVEVSGLRFLTQSQVLGWLGRVEGEPIVELKPAALAGRLHRHPRIAGVRVERGLDRRVHVAVDERRALALVLAGSLVEVDVDGVILPPLGKGLLPDLPILTGVTDRVPIPGDRLVDPTVLRTLMLLAELEARDPALSMQIAEIDLSARPLLAITLIGGRLMLKTHVESVTVAKLAGLGAVIDDLERRERRDVEIDLRFEGQLVVRPIGSLASEAGR